MHRFVEYPDAEAQAERLVQLVAGELAEAVIAKGHATLAVPGGTTPRSFLSHLSMMELDWEHVTVLLTDERKVPAESDRSNARLIRESLLQNVAAKARFAPLLNETASLEQVSEGLRDVLPLDVCVLGMGTDMHIASLFPGAGGLKAALSPNCSEVLSLMYSDRIPEARLSLTAPVLTAAANLHLLIKGADKRAALDVAAEVASPLEAPVKILLGRDARTIHFTEGASQ